MKILLAVDGSQFSNAAVESVTAHAWPRDAEVQVLHVLEHPTALEAREMAGYRSGLGAAAAMDKAQAKELVSKTAKRLRARGFKSIATLEEGDPKSKILDVANKWRPDLIVMGFHGRKGLARFLLGSVSETVARYAPCTVEIVRARQALRGKQWHGRKRRIRRSRVILARRVTP
jgi:nucleotide-binding universal stress UspA family protein